MPGTPGTPNLPKAESGIVSLPDGIARRPHPLPPRHKPSPLLFSKHTHRLMLILHTADWHLGNTFHRHNREAEHRDFLLWLIGRLREMQPDALLISGDVFDTPNPPASAERMYYEFLHAAVEVVPGLQIVITAGNHDSGSRLEAPASMLQNRGIYVRGTIHRDEEDAPLWDDYIIPLASRGSDVAECVVFAVPFLRSIDYGSGLTPEQGLKAFFDALHKRHRKSDFKNLPVVACAHFYAKDADINATEHSERLVVGGQDCVSADVVGETAYTALGHIHKAQQVSQKAWYAGSVLPMSFSEKGYHHGILAVTLEEEGFARVDPIAYEPLRDILSIPAHGAASPADVMDAISRLPERKKKDDGETWPYLEIRVREARPEPQLLNDVTAVLAEKAVRYCRMVRELPEARNEAQRVENIETLQTLTPEEMALRIFRARYKEEMPDEMLNRLKQVMY